MIESTIPLITVCALAAGTLINMLTFNRHVKSTNQRLAALEEKAKND